MNFKTIRIAILLLILAYIGIDTLLKNTRATQWKHPLRIVIYPINADNSSAAKKTIEQLKTSRFQKLNSRLQTEAVRYGLSISMPLHIEIAPELKSLPPPIPLYKSMLNTFWWSLRLRYWAWLKDNHTGIKPQVRAFLLFYDPKQHPGLAHSTGLKKSKIALIKQFASKHYQGQNNVVFLHELLHTLGATDKYDLRTNLPDYPEGYAEPKRRPLLPQRLAEIMGGRIPLTENKAVIPSSLEQTVVGPETALEIGWVK